MKNNDQLAIFNHVWDTAIYELDRLKENVDYNSLESCIKLITECKGRIITAGVGTSGAAAKKIAHSLSCIERPAFFLDPGDAVHGALGSVQSDDIAILLSKGGGTREILNTIPGLQAKKVPIIGITENTDSPLANQSTVHLKIAIEKEADEFNMLATTSTMMVIAVFDALCIVMMRMTGFSREQFAVIHPAGAVGERLLKGEKK